MTVAVPATTRAAAAAMGDWLTSVTEAGEPFERYQLVGHPEAAQQRDLIGIESPQNLQVTEH